MEKGMEKGRKQGMEKGRKQGMEEGKKQGRDEERRMTLDILSEIADGKTDAQILDAFPLASKEIIQKVRQMLAKA